MDVVGAASTPDGSAALTQPIVYFATDLNQPHYYKFLDGNLSLYTHSSPDKTTGNEDAIAITPVSAHTGVLIVADGVGGHATGSDAARLAIDELLKTIAKVGPKYALRDAILDGIERANEAVLALKSGAATTLAVVEIDGHSARAYHVGDTLILITGQRGRIKFENIPHSPIGYAVEAGLLDKDDAIHHTQRNVVSNVVGSTDMRIDIGSSITLAARDTLLVSSDAVSDNLYSNEIIDRIRIGSMQSMTNALLDDCRTRMLRRETGQPGHADDTSFILYRPGLDRK